MAAAPSRRRSRRPFLAVAILFLVAVGGAAICWAWSRHAAVPALPVINTQGVDPAVQRAVEAARAAVLRNPDSAEAWGKLGMILQSHGLPVEASNACFAQAERLDPRQPRWPYLQASLLLTTDPEAALVKLQRTVALCDCEPDAPRLLLGEKLLDQGKLPEAAQQFERALQQHPDNARAYLGLGRIAYERGELSESIPHVNRCTGDVHTRKAAHILLAQIYERCNNKPAAEQELALAAKLPNDTPWPDPYQDDVVRLRVGQRAILEVADRLLHQNQYSQALSLLKRTVHDYPNSAWAWEMTGRAYLGLNDLPAAEQALRKTIGLGPNMAEAQFHLGVALILQKKFPEAGQCFRKAAELKPGYALAYYNLGHSLKEQGDESGAVAAFRTAIGCKPDYSAAHYNLAALLVKKGQRDEAIIHLRHAVEFDTSNEAAKKLLEQLQK